MKMKDEKIKIKQGIEKRHKSLFNNGHKFDE